MPREWWETAPAFPALPPSMAVAWMREAAHLHGVCRESGGAASNSVGRALARHVALKGDLQ